ncbi:MAG: mechanosensitive ion channel [Thermodesulfobacteria bacterium]|nr:mechanosensitive ion channel [Thermodesulfobacteriota bacterium]
MTNIWEALQEFWRSLASTLGSSLPQILAAFLILIIGWIVARIIAAGIRKVLIKINLRGLLEKILREEIKISIENIIAKIVFYILFLFVLVAFFQRLQLTAVTEPLNNLLNEIIAFLPNLLSAALLIFLAWIIASIVRLVIKKGTAAIKLDERIAQKGAREEVPVSTSIANAAYWFVFLLFLPAILETLKMESLVVPVQELVSKILTYIPDIFAAVLILIVGWFIAHVIKLVVTGLLAALGVDQIGEKIGLGDKAKLSQIIGNIIYVLIFIPVLIAALNALKIKAISDPAIAMLNQLLSAIPLIFGAFVIIAVAYFVGKIVAKMVADILEGMGANKLPEKLGLGFKVDIVRLVSTIIMTLAVLLAFMEAAELLRLEYLSILINNLIFFGARAIIAVLILALGVWIGGLAQKMLEQSLGEKARVPAYFLKGAVIALAFAMALTEMGISKEIVVSAFTILMAGIAVAVALAFGLGCKDHAARLVDKWFTKE